MRLIDADVLKMKLASLINVAKSEPQKALLGRTIFVLSNMPTIDAEPVRHGRYVGTEYDGYADGNPVFYEWVCSECECIFEEEEPTYKYCPNCGAKMDGDENADD